MRRGFSLRSLGILWTLAAFAAGLVSAWLWLGSTYAWKAHLARAQLTGVALFESLRAGVAPPSGVALAPLSATEAGLAERGDFVRLPGAPHPAFVTNVSILTDPADPISGEVLSLAVLSGDLRYQLSGLVSDAAQTPPEKLGNLTRLLATFCTEPVVFARMGDDAWIRIDGTAVWGCAAAPRDLRLPAGIAAAVALAVLLTRVADTSAHFDAFAQALRRRRRLGGPESYAVEGPEELREIVAAVNAYLESEREQLSKRATVLSGVSHDLGTPATRLRLRTALIEDSELREKLEADIDRMTGMIESVLTYTRSELSVEEARQVSLTSLIEALVADYQDLGKPVAFRHGAPAIVRGGRSVFTSRPGQSAVPEERRVLAMARPIALQRALSNLIDNALKYGRRATVELEATAETAAITVEDEGSDYSVEDIEQLFAPFRRGANTRSIDGFGLGLTIVATVAEQHGGTLSFESGARGLRARLEIQRS